MKKTKELTNKELVELRTKAYEMAKVVCSARNLDSNLSHEDRVILCAKRVYEWLLTGDD